jgi:hypothetical protein
MILSGIAGRLSKEKIESVNFALRIGSPPKTPESRLATEPKALIPGFSEVALIQTQSLSFGIYYLF